MTFDNLPPGIYAVGACHDENDNDHLDTNFIGLPTEGYALSNGVRAVFFRPHFHEARSGSAMATSRSRRTSDTERRRFAGSAAPAWRRKPIAIDPDPGT